MGEVFEARDLSLGTPLAVKMIRCELAGDPASLERLRREVVLARRVTHPNVCRIFEFFEAPEGAFLTMELIEGETLSQRIRRSGPVSPGEALSILRDVAAGLEAIHASGIVHRDVKPGNVLLVDGGERERRAVVGTGTATTTKLAPATSSGRPGAPHRLRDVHAGIERAIGDLRLRQQRRQRSTEATESQKRPPCHRTVTPSGWFPPHSASSERSCRCSQENRAHRSHQVVSSRCVPGGHA